MSREIKFRAWDEKSKCMKDLIGFKECGKSIQVIFFDEDGDETFAIVDKKQIKLMQYTGLRDKKGKEICEGDIVRYSTYSYEEPIDDYEGEIIIGSYGVLIDGYNSDGEKDKYYLIEISEYINELERLGNIYENPEVLEEMGK